MKTIAVTENGQLVQKRVEVKPSEYTNVRWVLPTLAAGEALKLGLSRAGQLSCLTNRFVLVPDLNAVAAGVF